MGRQFTLARNNFPEVLCSIPSMLIIVEGLDGRAVGNVSGSGTKAPGFELKEVPQARRQPNNSEESTCGKMSDCTCNPVFNILRVQPTQ